MIAEVTARRRAEEERAQLLREQAARAEAEAAQQRIAEILESIDDAFFALDYAGRFTHVNRRGEQFLERHSAELLGRLCSDLKNAGLKFTF